MGWENITSVINVHPKQINLMLAKTAINHWRANGGLPDWGVATDKMAEPRAGIYQLGICQLGKGQAFDRRYLLGICELHPTMDSDSDCNSAV